jgi:ASC-1-like (ASCH) protein
MLQDLGVENCLPGIKDVDAGVTLYHGFPGYAEKEQQFGVIAMELVPAESSLTIGGL